MLVVSLCVNCRFWSHLGSLRSKVTIFAIQASLSTVHKEILKKNALTLLTTQKSPLGVECEFFDEHPRQFYAGVLPGGPLRSSTLHTCFKNEGKTYLRLKNRDSNIRILRFQKRTQSMVCSYTIALVGRKEFS